MASSGSFSFGCSAAGPLLPPPSFSFPSQPAASSFPFTNDPAPTPCRHATSPSEDSQAPVPAGFAPVLPSASPREALPKAPVPAGSALCGPEKLFSRPLCLLGLPLCGPALLPEKLFPRPLCLLGLPLCGPVLAGAFPLAPVPGGCAPVHPAVPPVAVSFHGHISGTQTPTPCARPLTGPCPARDHAFPSSIQTVCLHFKAMTLLG